VTSSDERKRARDIYASWAAEFYDELYAYVPISEVVATVRELAPSGAAVVDFVSATGRLASALADAGFSVTAVETAARFVDAHNGRDPLGRVKKVSIDIVDGRLPGEHAVALLANNVLNTLTDPSEQSQALRQVTASIAVGGLVIVEIFSPLAFVRMQAGETRHAAIAGGTALLFDAVVADVEAQRLLFQRSMVRGGRVASHNEVARYVWPAELDLMAQMTGLELTRRSSGWNGQPYSLTQPTVVSVYRKL
jgi:hypothetical protein